MTTDKQPAPPTTSTESGAEDAPTPPATEARKLTVDDVEAGEDVRGGGIGTSMGAMSHNVGSGTTSFNPDGY